MPSQLGSWSQQAQSIRGPEVGCWELVWKWEQLVTRPAWGGTLPESVSAAHPAEWKGVDDPRGVFHLQPLCVDRVLPLTVLLKGTVTPAVSGFPAEGLQSPELSVVKVFNLRP